MDERISNLTSELRKVAVDAEETFGVLTAEQLNWKPAENSWSVGQCFDHLIKTNHKFYPEFEKLAAGTRTNSFWENWSPFSGWAGRFLINAVSEDSKKAKAPSQRIVPPSEIASDIVERFAASVLHPLDGDAVKFAEQPGSYQIPEQAGIAVTVRDQLAALPVALNAKASLFSGDGGAHAVVRFPGHEEKEALAHGVLGLALPPQRPGEILAEAETLGGISAQHALNLESYENRGDVGIVGVAFVADLNHPSLHDRGGSFGEVRKVDMPVEELRPR